MSASGSGSTLSGSIDIGTAAADRVVIVAATEQNGQSLTSIVVNGVTLTAAVAGSGVYISTGLVTSGSGAQTVTVTWGAGSFETRTCAVWIANGLNSNTPKATGTVATNVTPSAISVTAGDLLFGVTMLGNSGTPEYNGNSTENAAGERQVLTGALSGFYGDWTVASTNASFSVYEAISSSARTCVSFR